MRQRIHDAPKACVKQLVRRTAGKLTVSQWNTPGEISFDIDSVATVHSILSLNELPGV